MIGAETLEQPFSACGLLEQAAQRSPIHGRSRVDLEPDDPTSALVHDDEVPMGFESKGLTPEEIDAPQTVFHVANEGQPGGSLAPLWPVVGGEDPSDDIFIERQGKGFGYLLGNFGAPRARIAAFHFQHESMSCREGPLGPGFPRFCEEYSSRYFHLISA